MPKLVKKPKINNITESSDWSVVFAKIMLFGYFEHNELVLLSSLNNKIRDTLKPLILTQFSVYNLCKKMEKNGGVDLKSLVKAIDTYILPVSKSVKAATLSYELPFTDINPLFDRLLHIQSLKIYNLKLDIISLNSLLEKLKCLKHLSFDAKIWIPAYLEEEEAIFNLPSSLVTLDIGGSIYYAENIEDEPQDFIRYTGYIGYDDIYGIFDSGALHPNLKTIKLDCPFIPYDALDAPILLTNNPNLTTFYIDFSAFNRINLELIKASKITKLNLVPDSGSSLDREFSQISDLKLESIHEMEVTIPLSEPSYLAQLVELSSNFPMLKTLSISHDGLSEKKFQKLLNSFPLITRLNIKITTTNMKPELNIENSSIKYLSIDNLNVLELDCNSFAKWNNLKLIKITHPTTRKTTRNIDKHLKELNNWKVITYEASTKSKNIHLFKV